MLRIHLFGKLRIRCNDRVFGGCDSIKSQELFCYLLLNRDRPHSREMLASLLWGDCGTTAQSKKYLSKALWQLRGALNSHPELAGDALIQAEQEWIQLRSVSLLWLDVAAFEEAYTSTKDVSGSDLDEQSAQRLEHAVQLYGGYLLENWYQDWCLYERQRYHEIYLLMLDKLMGYCEARHHFEAGLSYGKRILRYDRARERTHRRMIRLYYRSGHRTGALRQYEHCVDALKEELDVEPSRSTTALYEQVRADRLDQPPPILPEPIASPMREVLTYLRRLQADLAGFQRHVRQAALVAESELGRSNSHPGKSNEPVDTGN